LAGVTYTNVYRYPIVNENKSERNQIKKKKRSESNLTYTTVYPINENKFE
jgi:hypothetical protein